MNMKKFDCVEMMHRGAKKVHREIKGMTPEPEIAYWKERSCVLRKSMEAVKKRKKSSKSAA